MREDQILRHRTLQKKIRKNNKYYAGIGRGTLVSHTVDPEADEKQARNVEDYIPYGFMNKNVLKASFRQIKYPEDDSDECDDLKSSKSKRHKRKKSKGRS